MAFNSFTFLVFLAVVLGLYHLRISWTARKCVLLAGSYIFYAAWNPPLVSLIVISTLVDWFAAKHIYKSEGKRKHAWLLLTLGVNLGLLAYFKYGTFLMDNFEVLLAAFGIEYVSASANIILPIGISFYTFQTLSYSLDVYRGRSEPSDSFLDYALYVTFFPQLVAGPIVRSVDFLPQCKGHKRATSDQWGWGLILLTFGLFQKTILADYLFAPVADRIYAQPELVSTPDAWIGTLAFGGQIYFDFAGYSTCAIGIALCLGFVLPDNFRYPYGAIGFSDFWRRWHITLSTWLRDYLYIPLGGNRAGEWMRARNLMLTMLIGGLWHGAGWTFVFWGGLHGAYLIGERLLHESIGHWAAWRGTFARLALGALTFLLVTVTWVFFRAQDFTTASEVLTAMFGGGAPSLALAGTRRIAVALCAVLLFVFQSLMRDSSLEALLGRLPRCMTVVGIAAAIFTMIFIQEDTRGFIYFQF